MAMINQLLMNETAKPDLWIYFSMFSKDAAMQAKAVFKAYELEPTSPFV